MKPGEAEPAEGQGEADGKSSHLLRVAYIRRQRRLRSDPVDQDAAVAPGAGPSAGDHLSSPAPGPPSRDRRASGRSRPGSASRCWTRQTVVPGATCRRDRARPQPERGALAALRGAHAVVTDPPASSLWTSWSRPHPSHRQRSRPPRYRCKRVAKRTPHLPHISCRRRGGPLDNAAGRLARAVGPGPPARLDWTL